MKGESDAIGTAAGEEKLVCSEVEAATLLGISKGTLQTLRKTGRIAAVRIGARIVYEKDELRAFLRRNRTA